MYGLVTAPPLGESEASLGDSAAACAGAGVVFGPSGCAGCCSGYDGRGTDEIQAIQIYLALLGYLTSADATGRYGQRTYDAVLKFQQDYGLPEDGRVGGGTMPVLYDQAQKRRVAEEAAGASDATGEYQPPTKGEAADALEGLGLKVKLTAQPWFWPVVAAASAALVGGLIWWRRS
jgi:peptidoglycan hydrolase-like protein with peptidoglycan-binding domain